MQNKKEGVEQGHYWWCSKCWDYHEYKDPKTSSHEKYGSEKRFAEIRERIKELKKEVR